MTAQEYNVLAQLTYSDFGFDGTSTSGTLQEICQRIVDNPNSNMNEATMNAARDIASGK